MKRFLGTALAGVMTIGLLSGCGGTATDEVIFYTNADDEAVEAMKATLDANGYEGQYMFQGFGTSELGGKLLAEGTNLEADAITMSSYYIESAQEEHSMFKSFEANATPLSETPDYYYPVIGNQGALIINTAELEDAGITAPASIKDLANPEFEGKISVVDITGSSTAWLMIQALVSEYGASEAEEILSGIYKNAGAHLESSGSGPIKKVRSAEVAVGFGLRHQAVADKADGLPIDYVDPTEGNFSLTESIAIVDKGEDTNPLAEEMVKCIIENGREELMKNYPLPVYEGETADSSAISENSKVFPEPLTVTLLTQHTEISENAKN